MRASVEFSDSERASSFSFEDETKRAEAVLKELDRILASRYFRSAGRSRQFLQMSCNTS